MRLLTRLLQRLAIFGLGIFSVWLIVFCAAPLLAIFAPTFSLGYGERMIAM